MSTKEQLKIFLDFKGITPTAFERTMNWGVGAFTKAKSITADRVTEVLAKYPELSAEWLMRGCGEMIYQPQVPTLDIDRIATLVDTIATLQKTIGEKDKTIAILTEQIQQLKNQLK